MAQAAYGLADDRFRPIGFRSVNQAGALLDESAKRFNPSRILPCPKPDFRQVNLRIVQTLEFHFRSRKFSFYCVVRRPPPRENSIEPEYPSHYFNRPLVGETKMTSQSIVEKALDVAHHDGPRRVRQW